MHAGSLKSSKIIQKTLHGHHPCTTDHDAGGPYAKSQKLLSHYSKDGSQNQSHVATLRQEILMEEKLTNSTNRLICQISICQHPEVPFKRHVYIYNFIVLIFVNI